VLALWTAVADGWTRLKARAQAAIAKGPERPPRRAEAAPKPVAPRRRPESLEDRYQLVDGGDVADEAFRRLQSRLFAAAERGPRVQGKAIFREAGRLAPPSPREGGNAYTPGRPYFFIKPESQTGYLFERSGTGWLVTPAEKIVARDLFLRAGEPLDAVNLYVARDRAVTPRVRSQVAGDGLLAFAVYEGRVLHQLGLE
jgi:hypothetical protein